MSVRKIITVVMTVITVLAGCSQSQSPSKQAGLPVDQVTAPVQVTYALMEQTCPAMLNQEFAAASRRQLKEAYTKPRMTSEQEVGFIWSRCQNYSGKVLSGGGVESRKT